MINIVLMFHTPMRRNALRGPHIPPDAKKNLFSIMCPDAFYWTHLAHPSMKNSTSTFVVPEEPECTTWPVDPTGCKNTSSAQHVPTCFLWKPSQAHPEHENYCIDVSRLGRIEMHYMTHKSHRMEKHKFGVTCPSALFVKSILVTLEHEK
jgi:hypothetical protein